MKYFSFKLLKLTILAASVTSVVGKKETEIEVDVSWIATDNDGNTIGKRRLSGTDAENRKNRVNNDDHYAGYMHLRINLPPVLELAENPVPEEYKGHVGENHKNENAGGDSATKIIRETHEHRTNSIRSLTSATGSENGNHVDFSLWQNRFLLDSSGKSDLIDSDGKSKMGISLSPNCLYLGDVVESAGAGVKKVSGLDGISGVKRNGVVGVDLCDHGIRGQFTINGIRIDIKPVGVSNFEQELI